MCDIGWTYCDELGYNDGKQKGDQIKIHILDSLIAINPLYHYFVERANLKDDQEKYDEALGDYLSAYKIEGNIWPDLLCDDIALNYKLTNQFNDAIKYYTISIEDYKTWATIQHDKLAKSYDNRGYCKMKLENYTGAIQDYQLAVSEYSIQKPFPTLLNAYNLLKVYNSLGRVRMLSGDNQNAVIDLSKGIEILNEEIARKGHSENFIRNELAYTYYLLGFAKIELNDKTGACEDWHKSNELGDEDAYDLIRKNCEKIKLTKEGNVYYINVKIGSITRKFILDTGASEVNISEELERELIFEGIITKSDYLQKGNYKTANGSIQECRRVLIKSITVGGYTISNVTASISNDNSPILLGKSFLDKFKKWSIDNQKSELDLEN